MNVYAGNHCATGGERCSSIRAWGEQLDKNIRKIMVSCKARFSKCSKYRPYLPTAEMGMGLKSIADEVEEATVYAACYLLLTPSLIRYREIAEKLHKRDKRSMLSDFAWITKQYPELEINISWGCLKSDRSAFEAEPENEKVGGVEDEEGK
ncbi:unnamed protein product [Caenorhabditis sp. 36 PRJEB53466]|nr:unnamed protein product [Caenorhabditis sp. 36 PRJEB53466]